jgi:hypothetical protein
MSRKQVRATPVPAPKAPKAQHSIFPDAISAEIKLCAAEIDKLNNTTPLYKEGEVGFDEQVRNTVATMKPWMDRLTVAYGRLSVQSDGVPNWLADPGRQVKEGFIRLGRPGSKPVSTAGSVYDGSVYDGSTRPGTPTHGRRSGDEAVTSQPMMHAAGYTGASNYPPGSMPHIARDH